MTICDSGIPKAAYVDLQGWDDWANKVALTRLRNSACIGRQGFRALIYSSPETECDQAT